MSRRPSARRTRLQAVAKETLAELPSILQGMPGFHATESSLFTLSKLQPLDAATRPQYNAGPASASAASAASEAISQRSSTENASDHVPHNAATVVRVVNQDTFDAAIELAGRRVKETSNEDAPLNPRVVVLNLASDKNPGGGWLNGALAQEEALCYRSSLYLSLHRLHYPLGQRSAIYSPNVVIIRASSEHGHQLLVPHVQPTDLPTVSSISIAAIRRPEIKNVVVNGTNETIYSNPKDRELMKGKMRLALRLAATQGHRRLVLGALGCGAFRNPPKVVAVCWREVLQEPEFAGGWWDDICFAVLSKGDDAGDSRSQDNNFSLFRDELDGLAV